MLHFSADVTFVLFFTRDCRCNLDLSYS